MRKFGKLASVAMLVLAAISIVGLVGCNNVASYELKKSTDKAITSFVLKYSENTTVKANGELENTCLPGGQPITTDVKGIIDGTYIWLDLEAAGVKKSSAYKVSIELAGRGATVSPASGTVKSFTEAVEYTVTAEDGTTTVYTVNDFKNLKEDKVVDNYAIYLNGNDLTTKDGFNKNDGTASYNTYFEENPQCLTMLSGKDHTIQLTAKHPAEGSASFPYMVKWSSNSDFFTVNETTGLVTASATDNGGTWSTISGYTNVRGGSGTVTANIYYKDGTNKDVKAGSQSVNVTVMNAATKAPTITLKLPTVETQAVSSGNPLEQRTVNLKTYTSNGYVCTASIGDKDADVEVKFYSSDNRIATVDVDSGIVTAVNIGDVTITAVATCKATATKNKAEKTATTTIKFIEHN